MRLSKKLDCFVISDNVKNDRAEKDSAIGTFIKYYKISQLIHTQIIAN